MNHSTDTDWYKLDNGTIDIAKYLEDKYSHRDITNPYFKFDIFSETYELYIINESILNPYRRLFDIPEYEEYEVVKTKE